MAEIYKGVNVKNFEIISTVEDTCFFNIPEGEIYKVNLIILHIYIF